MRATYPFPRCANLQSARVYLLLGVLGQDAVQGHRVVGYAALDVYRAAVETVVIDAMESSNNQKGGSDGEGEREREVKM